MTEVTPRAQATPVRGPLAARNRHPHRKRGDEATKALLYDVQLRRQDDLHSVPAPRDRRGPRVPRARRTRVQWSCDGLSSNSLSVMGPS